jgi:hypothetical protein
VTGDGQARFCEGCALKAHGIQSPEMVTAAKLSSQPRTESCVVATTALRSVDREVVGRNVVNGKITPKSNLIEVADPISLWGRPRPRMRYGECPEMLPGSYRWHATEGVHGNKGELSGSSDDL